MYVCAWGGEATWNAATLFPDSTQLNSIQIDQQQINTKYTDL